jgi:hypothetical protein
MPYAYVHAPEQVHDPILHYEEYIMGGRHAFAYAPAHAAEMRNADRGGPDGTEFQSGVATPVNNPSILAPPPPPQYVELSYDQIFDQPGELPTTVSPSGGSPLDPFPDAPSPHG